MLSSAHRQEMWQCSTLSLFYNKDITLPYCFLGDFNSCMIFSNSMAKSLSLFLPYWSMPYSRRELFERGQLIILHRIWKGGGWVCFHSRILKERFWFLNTSRKFYWGSFFPCQTIHVLVFPSFPSIYGLFY